MEYDEKNDKIIYSDEEMTFFKQMAELYEKQYLYAIQNANIIINRKIKDKNVIEQGLDMLFEFLEDDAALLAYRRLCKHYWFIDKVATSEYIKMYSDEYDPNHEKFGRNTNNKNSYDTVDKASQNKININENKTFDNDERE